MAKYIMVGCDLHDKTMLVKIAHGLGRAEKRSYGNDPAGRAAMIRELQKRSAATGGAKVIFAHEASGQGFGLYDDLTDAGLTCHVLAPTRMASSDKDRRQKTDERDANRILELLRGHLLAGNSLPTVWVPDPQTRDDREVVRARLDAGHKLTILKLQVGSLLKRNGLRRAPELGRGWTVSYERWIWQLVEEPATCEQELGSGARAGLRTLLRQMEAIQEEIAILDREVARLSEMPRYASRVSRVRELKGVGVLTAMVFLTEMGDLGRFANRRQVANYLGLVPSSRESGESDDRKGHITHAGSARVRKMLCQATWARIRQDPGTQVAYERIVAKNRKKKKIAVVAMMRRLAIRMWHRASEVPGKRSTAGRGRPAAVA